MTSIVYNQDCLEAMRQMPDNAFDLAVVDPPYGGGTEEFYNRFGNKDSRFEKYKRSEVAGGGCTRTGGTWAEKYGKKIVAWDIAPGKEYFEQLFRVSRNQIIWGGNYFELPPTRCFLVWRKLTISDKFSMAMCEYAWTSFDSNAKLFECAPQGKPGDRFHPCLPAGTMVWFGDKWKPIECVSVGEQNEFGTVAAKTTHIAEKMVVIEADGEQVEATWNHPFLVKRGESIYWVNAEQIRKGDQLLSLWRQNTPLQKRATCDIGRTGHGCAWNIVSFGKNITGKYQRACKSITLMATKQITILPTSNLSRPLNTSGSTKVADLRKVCGISLASAVESLSQSQKKTGILTKKLGGLQHHTAARVMWRRLSENAVCVLRTVGSVKIIKQKTKVYNLSLDGVPAFETKIGITHNTQKPIELYDWVFRLFAEKGQNILDTHLGSGSSRIAGHKAGLNFVWYEIDKEYFDKAEERFRKHTAQMGIWDFIM